MGKGSRKGKRGSSRRRRERRTVERTSLSQDEVQQLQDPEQVVAAMVRLVSPMMRNSGRPWDERLEVLRGQIDEQVQADPGRAVEIDSSAQMGVDVEKRIVEGVRIAMTADNLETRARAMGPVLSYLVVADDMIRTVRDHPFHAAVRRPDGMKQNSLVRHLATVMNTAINGFSSWEKSDPFVASRFYDQMMQQTITEIENSPSIQAGGLDRQMLYAQAHMNAVGVRVLHANYARERLGSPAIPGADLISFESDYEAKLALLCRDPNSGVAPALNHVAGGHTQMLERGGLHNLQQLYLQHVMPRYQKEYVDPANKLITAHTNLFGGESEVAEDMYGNPVALLNEEQRAFLDKEGQRAFREAVFGIGPPQCYALIAEEVVSRATRSLGGNPFSGVRSKTPAVIVELFAPGVIKDLGPYISSGNRKALLSGIRQAPNMVKDAVKMERVVFSSDTHGYDPADNQGRVFGSNPNGRFPDVGLTLQLDLPLAESNPFDLPDLVEQRHVELLRLGARLRQEIAQNAQLGVQYKEYPFSGAATMQITPGEGTLAFKARVASFEAIASVEFSSDLHQSFGRWTEDGAEDSSAVPTLTDDVISVLALAAVHDQVVRKLTVRQMNSGAVTGDSTAGAVPENAQTTDGSVESDPSSDFTASEPGASFTDDPGPAVPSKRSIHVLENYVVIDPEDEVDEDGMDVRVQEDPNGELTVERFVRPHWVETSVQLVRASREKAFETVRSMTNLPDDRAQVIHGTLLGGDAHMTPPGEIIQRLFSADFGSAVERDAIAEALDAAERDEYVRRYLRYSGQDVIDMVVQGDMRVFNELSEAGAFDRLSDSRREILEEIVRAGEGLPTDAERYELVVAKIADAVGRTLAQLDGIRFALPSAQEIAARRDAEVEARNQAEREAMMAGRLYQELFQQPPPRRTETQTYRVGHVREVSTVAMEKGVGRTPRGTTVVKASSAYEAALRLAGIEPPESAS